MPAGEKSRNRRLGRVIEEAKAMNATAGLQVESCTARERVWKELKFEKGVWTRFPFTCILAFNQTEWFHFVDETNRFVSTAINLRNIEKPFCKGSESVF